MSFGTPDSQDDGALMSEINMTPLVDVMLVLLIIFIITIPVINHAVRIELPHASSQREETKPARVSVAVDAVGQVFWNGQPVDDATLEARLVEAAALQPQPELRLQGDRAVRYERVADVVSAARRAGLARIGFVTQPQR
ncbi:MAG: Biopolymer transport protein [Pseudomonadota bacterium]